MAYSLIPFAKRLTSLRTRLCTVFLAHARSDAKLMACILSAEPDNW